MGATNSRGQKRAGELLYSDRTLPAPAVARAEGIVSNNSNTTYNFGRDVINNNWVNNYVCPESTTPDLAKKQEESMNTIRAVLGDRFVQDALHTTQPADGGCMPGTRETVLSKIMTWAKDSPMSIIWLAGMAGTGKTSIALTLCRMLDVDTSVVLGGTFFCSRSAGSIPRTEPRRILPTLAASLACQFTEYAAMLAAQLKEDDGLAYKPVSSQIVSLFIKPFAVLNSIAGPIVFIVDALDECNDERELAQLLAVIADLRSDARLKFILTSRPEMYIRGTPISNPSYNDILHLHTISEEEVECDIRRYIVGTLQVAAPYATWYMNDNIETLVRLSDGLFIFASTALKYVLDMDNDEQRARRLSKATSFSTTRTAAKTTMDRMYELVLTEAYQHDKVDDDELEDMRRILACILQTRAPLSVEALADLMAITPLQLRGLLRRLHSLVYIPPNDMEPGLRTLHASFGDYLLSRATSEVRITTCLADSVFALGCLDLMAKRLHFNVSRSQSSHEQNPSARPGSITLSLEYACLQWIYHVASVTESSGLDEKIRIAFCPRFLFWLEVLSILGQVWRAAAMLLFAASTVRSAELSRFLRDAHAFVASSWEAIAKSAPHIYISALPFTRKASLIYQTFAPFYSQAGPIAVETFGMDCREGRLLMTLGSRNESALVYSPDGCLLASGDGISSVYIWDTRSGEKTTSLLVRDGSRMWPIAFTLQSKCLLLKGDTGIFTWNFFDDHSAPQKLYDHTEIGSPTALTPDGSLLASALKDYTIRVWKTTTRDQLSRLSGCTEVVSAISISPRGEILASASGRKKILLWKIGTGERIGQLNQAEDILSLSLSPDGTRLASTCGAKIQIWQLQSGTTIATLHGHISPVQSIQFSPDGKSLISLGTGIDLRIWTLQDEAAETSSIVLDVDGSDIDDFSSCVATFSPDSLRVAVSSFEGPTCILDVGSARQAPLSSCNVSLHWAAAVSSDGKLVVSGSNDHNVCVRDVWTGKLVFPSLLGHTDQVLSASISPDGRLIASGSKDGTLRIWDLQTGVAIGEPLMSQQPSVSIVAFSPDTRLLASVSQFDIVSVWDIYTGQPYMVYQLLVQHNVDDVVFSPDSRLLAVVSWSGHIRFWQAETGESTLKPIKVGKGCTGTIAFSPDGVHIVSGADSSRSFDTRYIWDIRTGEQILVLKGHGWSVGPAAFSPDGRLISTGAMDQGICLWSAATGTLLAALPVHGFYTCTSVSFTDDGRFVVSCSEDRFQIWDVGAACSLSSASASDSVATLAFSRMNKDGWLLGPRNELLLWVPEDYRNYIQVYPCMNLIGRRRAVITANDSSLYNGKNWTACWSAKDTSSPVSRIM